MEHLQNFYCFRHRYTLKALDEIVLPPFKGFALRGVFGTVLRELVCTETGQDCFRCSRRTFCSYVYLFETVPDAALADAAKFSSYPRPYVINPPLDACQSYRQGSLFSFETVLIGRAGEFLPHVVATFEEIGRRGFRRKGTPGRFILHMVESLEVNNLSHLVYREGNFVGKSEPMVFKDIVDTMPAAAGSAVLTFLTPVRIEEKGALVRRAPPFSQLVSMLVQRANLLNYLHCGGSTPAGDMPMIELASVSLCAADLCWHELARYSNRQKKRMLQGGLLGSVTYEGNEVGAALPLLRLGEFINMGKSTTFGLGRFRLAVG